MNDLKILQQILLKENIIQSINDNFNTLLDIIPELNDMINFPHNHPHHHLDVWNHTLLALSFSKVDSDIRLCLLLHDIGKPHCYQDSDIRHFKGHPLKSSDISRNILNRLGYNKNYVDEMCYLIENHDRPIRKNEIINNYEITLKKFMIQFCDALAHNPEKLEKRVKYLKETYVLLEQFKPNTKEKIKTMIEYNINFGRIKMNSEQIENFYSNNKKEYEIINNQEFIDWLNNKVKEGFYANFEIKDLQNIIDKISNWYIIDYLKEEENNNNFNNLMSILNSHELSRIYCGYRTDKDKPIFEYDSKGNIIYYENNTFAKIKFENNMEYIVCANYEDGVINSSKYLFKKFNLKSKKRLTLDELLLILKNSNKENIDYTSLEQCVINHNTDLELRKKILELVALKLLCCEDIPLEDSYDITLKFINEFNNHLKNLNLNIDDIKEKINLNSKQKVKKLTPKQ